MEVQLRQPTVDRGSGLLAVWTLPVPGYLSMHEVLCTWVSEALNRLELIWLSATVDEAGAACLPCPPVAARLEVR